MGSVSDVSSNLTPPKLSTGSKNIPANLPRPSKQPKYLISGRVNTPTARISPEGTKIDSSKLARNQTSEKENTKERKIVLNKYGEKKIIVEKERNWELEGKSSSSVRDIRECRIYSPLNDITENINKYEPTITTPTKLEKQNNNLSTIETTNNKKQEILESKNQEEELDKYPKVSMSTVASQSQRCSGQLSLQTSPRSKFSLDTQRSRSPQVEESKNTRNTSTNTTLGHLLHNNSERIINSKKIGMNAGDSPNVTMTQSSSEEGVDNFDEGEFIQKALQLFYSKQTKNTHLFEQGENTVFRILQGLHDQGESTLYYIHIIYRI